MMFRVINAGWNIVRNKSAFILWGKQKNCVEQDVSKIVELHMIRIGRSITSFTYGLNKKWYTQKKTQ